MQSKQRRLLIVEEALKDYTGHWYEYDKAVTEINRLRGVDVAIAAHQTVSPEIVQELKALPLFQYTNWDGIYYSPSALKRYWGIGQHNWRVYKTLDKFLASSEPFDCIFVPTVIIYHLAAWLLLVRKYQGKKFKRLVLFFRNNAGSYPNNSIQPVFKRSTNILKKTIQSFQCFIQSGVVCLATDSSRLALEYNILTGVDVKVFPSPRIKLLAEQIVQKSPGELVVMSCLGPPRLEKGIDLLQLAILHLIKEHPELNVKFIIQWNREIYYLDGSKLEPNPKLENSQNVLLLKSDLSSDEYDQYLAQSDCIVLPYRRESYYARISGIAVEAATAGIPIIFTKDTWMEDAVSQYGAGLGVENENVLDLAEKIYLMALQISKYRAEAMVKAKLAQAYHSPENFLKCLWGSETSDFTLYNQ
ncbi:MAG: glycosyltransferase [Aphanothece sp. CMT-3BRIN-NPC111]|jgi:glycosyltransferase involved in cell wall biosynthesis|nr:glycosyltransferase [Aphanothece sp. CMT-3BRIN-NPC111]